MSSLAVLWVGLTGCHTPASASRVESLPFFDERTFTPHWLSPDAVPADFHQIRPFSLTNQRGETITESEMDGRISVVNYFFATCSGICPKLSQSMKSVDASFESSADVVLMSHSATPQEDTVSALAAFATREGVASSQWHLLTGDRSLIYELGRDGYFIEEDLGEEKSDDDFLHTENIVLLDRQRRIRGIYNGLNQTSVQQLITDIQTLMAEPVGES